LKADKAFLKIVIATLATMREDQHRGYLRGLLIVGGNSATTAEIKKLYDKCINNS
jgi:hypothetical protein